MRKRGDKFETNSFFVVNELKAKSSREAHFLNRIHIGLNQLGIRK